MGHNSLCFRSGHEKLDDPFNRRLIESLARKMTVGITAIAELQGGNPVIVFCADRLISGEIEFNKGSQKIHSITSNCYLIDASENVLVSDLVIKEITDKFSRKDHKPIKEIIDFIKQACEDQYHKTLEKDVLAKYNLIVEKLGVDPNEYATDSLNAIKTHHYPRFEFLIFGFDDVKSPHIYKINEKGKFEIYDSFGFATIGSGAGLANSEMTKLYYSPVHPLSIVIPRVYFAKKASERAGGVGNSTDFYFLSYKKIAGEDKCTLFELTHETDLSLHLDNAVKNIKDNEIQEIDNIRQFIDAIFHKNTEKDNKPTS